MTVQEDFARPSPADLDAERWCLSALMSGKRALAEVCELLEPGDFYRPAHQMIYRACVSLFAQGIEADAVTVRAYLEESGEISRCGGPVYVAELYGLPSVSAAAGRYAAIIRDRAARRKVIEIGTRLLHRGYELDHDLAELVSWAQGEVGRAVMTAGDARRLGTDLQSLDGFAANEAVRQAAVIPGLLDHMDRVVLVGLEGDGKSVVAAQMAMCAAAGVHPFTYAPVPPVRALICDFENPPHLLQTRMRRLRDIAERQPGWSSARMSLFVHPDYMDLTQPSNQFRLTEVIRSAKPDFIAAGPIYKMMIDRGQGAEQLHSQVTAYWDRVRAETGAAVWLETHPPKAPGGQARRLEPYGWGGYMRWPEFGLTLERCKGEWRLGRFKGDREEGRTWPEKLSRSTAPLPCWPWEATYPAGTFTDPR